MNIYFTNKFKILENNLKYQKDKNKILENHINNYKTQETDIKYLKFKINNYEEKLIFLGNKIDRLNTILLYLYLIHFLFIIKIFKDNFM